jgi:hypothetical protein
VDRGGDREARGLSTKGWTRAWRPTALVTQIREALGAARFAEVFAAGTRLDRPEAVAAAHGHRVADSRVR